MSNVPLNAEELNRLQAISTELNRMTDLETLCWAITEWVAELTHLEDCVVYVRLGNVLTQMAALGMKSDDGESITNRIGLPVGVGVVGSVAISAEPTYIPDVSKDSRYIFDEYPGASEFACPMVHRGEVVGVLDAEHEDLDGISLGQRQILQSLAVLSAPHLAALVSQDDDPRPEFGQVIADLAHLQPQHSGNLRSVFANFTERAARTLHASRVNIWLFNTALTELRCVDHYDLRQRRHSEGAVLARKDFPAYFEALEQERVIMANDALKDARTQEFSTDYLPDNDIRSMLDAPIRQDGEVVGVVCVEQTGMVREWKNEEASFVATLSDLATIALLSENKSRAESALAHAQKMESLGRLAGGIAHDFNNLLTVISGAVETLQLQLSEQASAARMLNLIMEASERAGRLTRNLMAFGGNQALTLTPVSASKLCDAIAELTEGILRENINVRYETPAEDVWVNGDATQLEQVLLNLILNGIDAMPDGGEISVLFKTADDRLIISVTDAGTGIDEATRRQVFEPFFTTKGAAGTGLGLSICQGIVRQHKGTLACESTLGEGSTFTVSIPTCEVVEITSTALEEAEPEPASRPAGPISILLVEDELGVRNVVAQMLGALGHEPRVAVDAADALEIIESQDIDLLLSDVVMPDIQGPELYKLAIKLKPSLKALFVSGYTDDVLKAVPIDDRRVAFLSKPFTLQQLNDAIDRLSGL